MDASEKPITPDILQVLQLRTANNPWLPGLREFTCYEVTAAFVPFVPLFLSPQTVEVFIVFAEDPPTAVVVSTISRLPTLCPDLKYIAFYGLPRHPVITEAVSETLLACKRDTFQLFRANSPLTEEAREVLYQLPRLFGLWAVIQGPTSLPKVALPNLTTIGVEYDGDLD